MPAATVIYVTHQFVGFHRWKDAPHAVRFLREYHRRVFHVKLAVRVYHEDRETEFFDLKARLGRYLETFRNQYFDHSCETLARMIRDDFKAEWVDVSEDGENGAVVYCSVIPHKEEH